MALRLCHPEIANRPCELCAEWLFNEKTGDFDRTNDGKPIRRPKVGVVAATPCKQPNGSCPKGTPEQKRSLTPQNEKAYRHYLECKATGRFPSDSIVVENAGIIREVEERVERDGQKLLRILLEQLVTRASL